LVAVTAHIAGIPVEETALSLAPVFLMVGALASGLLRKAAAFLTPLRKASRKIVE